VKIPTYYKYLFNAFFLSLYSYLQYFTFIIYLLENLLFYGVLLISTSFIANSINYILIRISYKNIKEIAEKKHFVSVLREGTWKDIENSELVPGDLYRPS
jgi:cation-transporting P-type ATPase 13A2